MDYAYSQKAGWPCLKLERKSFLECDHIVTVAESAKESLELYFPEFVHKMHVIHNGVSTDTVRSLSEDLSLMEDMEQTNEIRIVTVARLVEEKGVFLALDACKILVEQGFEISWYLIGNGPLFEELTSRAKELGIENNFFLLGEKENPYPYMGQCDIYVQPSKTEAHCVAVEEAITLKRPIIVTDIPSFNNQIQNEETGIIVKLDAMGIAQGIKQLIQAPEKRKLLTCNLQNTSDRHEKQLRKFYSLIGG
jgi:glycosyltransferase involved in cell wall biosynthesis